MPASCVVRKCGNRKSGHRFPKDEARMKDWLEAIKRPTFKPSKHSRVCKAHFTSEDYTFPKETAHPNPTPRLKADAVPKLFKRKQGASPDVFEGLLIHDQPALLSSLNFQYTGDNVESVTKLCAWCCLQLEETPSTANTLGNCVTTQTSKNPHLCISKYIEGMVDLHYWTGLENLNHFAIIMSNVRGCTNNLFYYPGQQPVKGSCFSSPCNELFLTLTKLYRDMPFKELGTTFGIPASSAASIFITWINLLYCIFKDLDLCVKHACFSKGASILNDSCALVMYCAEVNVQKPFSLVAQQLTYSKSKGRYTVKVLVCVCGCCGAIIYASNGYPGSLTTKEVVGNCKFRNLFPKTSSSCEVDLEKHNSQFTAVNAMSKEESRNHSLPCGSEQNVVASYARMKMRTVKASFGILSNQVCTSDMSLAGRILFVCCMLANLKEGHLRALHCKRDIIK